MPVQNSTLITDVGLAKLASTTIGASTLSLSTFKIGDGSGSEYVPTSSQTALKNVQYSGDINRLIVNADNPNRFTLEALIPISEGGYYIREIGYYDGAGDLIIIANVPESYKPTAAGGATADVIIKTISEVNNAENITLEVDPSVILVSQNNLDAHNRDIAAHDNAFVSRINTHNTDPNAHSDSAGSSFASGDFATGVSPGDVVYFSRTTDKFEKANSATKSTIGTGVRGQTSNIIQSGIFVNGTLDTYIAGTKYYQGAGAQAGNLITIDNDYYVGTAISGEKLLVGIDTEKASVEPFAVLNSTDTIPTNKLSDSIVTSVKIAPDAVTREKIANGSITSAKISNGTITTGDLSDGAVTNLKLADNAVSNSRIETNAITADKIRDNVITSNKILLGTITGNRLANETVDSTKIADAAITTSQLANGSVSEVKLDADSVATDKIINSAVTSVKLNNNAVTTDKIFNRAVTSDKLANGSVTPDKLSIEAKKIDYDIPFNAGVDLDQVAENLEIKHYGSMIMARNVNVNSVVANLETNPTGSGIIFDITSNNISIYTTKPTISITGVYSAGAFIANPRLIEGAVIRFLVSGIGTTTPGKGLRISIKGDA